MTPRATPLPLALALALCLSPVERVLCSGSLAEALAYAVDAEEQEERPTMPPGGE